MGTPLLDILIPVCHRPHKVLALVASIRATTPDARVLFITDPSDGVEQDAISQADCEWIATGARTYAEKINAGVRHTDGEWVVFAADDLIFHDHTWASSALWKAGDPTRAGSSAVVGLNDLIPRPHRPKHATHFLVDRFYAEYFACADGSPGPLHEGYRHWYVDDEFIATARWRGEYAYAQNAHVRHDHPMVGTAPMDPIYRVGYDHDAADRAVFLSREHLWTP